MDLANNIKDNIPLSIIQDLMDYIFYNQQLNKTIEHKTEFIKQGKKSVFCTNCSNSYIKWHAVDVSNLSMFITNYEQVGLRGMNF